LTKIPLTFSVSYFCLGGLTHQRPPWRRESDHLWYAQVQSLAYEKGAAERQHPRL